MTDIMTTKTVINRQLLCVYCSSCRKNRFMALFAALHALRPSIMALWPGANRRCTTIRFNLQNGFCITAQKKSCLVRAILADPVACDDPLNQEKPHRLSGTSPGGQDCLKSVDKMGPGPPGHPVQGMVALH